MKEMLGKLLNEVDGAEKIVFVGIGEEKLSDDGVGPFIISELLIYSNKIFLFINAGIT
jgi:Ni,Fe-hydrogenase maturation factor